MNNKIMLSDLCVVILECPYITLSQQNGREIFSNMMNVKIKGYASVHDDKVMPVDTTDFIATHMIVADKRAPFEKIYMSYKSTSYKMCDRYSLPFPFMTMLKNHAPTECFSKMEEIMKSCREKNEDLSYDTGWTINPEIRGDKEFQSILKDLITLFVVNHHNDYRIPHWVTLGICKVKTDQYFLKMGLEEISTNSILLHPFLHNTDARAVISMNGKYTDFVFETAKKYQFLWDNRIVISSKDLIEAEKAA